MSALNGAVLVHAPNVHTGGGAVLLQALFDAWPAEASLHAWLDARARGRWRLPPQAVVTWVAPTLLARWAAERSLRGQALPGDRLLCFHGLPPLWRSPAKTTVFVQNRLHLRGMPLQAFRWKTRFRLLVEQQLAQRLRNHVDSYWVQTGSMAEALRAWWGERAMPAVQVLGFVPPIAVPPRVVPEQDFIYVADGEAHKNHRRLLSAWQLLAQDGVRPSLALTLGERDAALRSEIEAAAAQHGLRIRCLPAMDHNGVLAAYARSGALVFPSLGESYGLPLIEAAACGLPIVAAERDYVREVCVPTQTFDPESPRSIARAVQRQLGVAVAPVAPVCAGDFLKAWLSA